MGEITAPMYMMDWEPIHITDPSFVVKMRE